jgi:lysophospholipase L1-like esterase
MSRRALFGRITHFDVLISLTALLITGACLALAIANRSGWTWNYKDSLGLGLILCTTLASILPQRRVSAPATLWPHLCTALLMIVAAIVLFRRSEWLWLAVGAIVFLFAVCRPSKAVSGRLVREDLYRGLWVVGGTFLALILAEAIVRLSPGLLSEGARARLYWQAAASYPWHVPHPYIGHLHNLERLRLTKATIHARGMEPWPPAKFDAWGFRNTEPWPTQADIVTLGDSMTYSLSVKDEQAWPVLLERELAPRRVLNLGLIGGAPQQYLRVYETFGAKLSPKILLVGLFLETDLEGAIEFDAWSRAKGYESFIDFVLAPHRVRARWWLQESYLYALLKDIRLTLIRDLVASNPSESILEGKTVQLADGGEVQLFPRVLARAALFNSPTQPAFALVLKTLEDLRDLAIQPQTQFLVLLIPSKEEVYLPIVREAAADLAAQFIPELSRRRIAYLDLGPGLRQRAASGESLFWEVGAHPNARGYAVIADLVQAYLREHAVRYGINTTTKLVTSNTLPKPEALASGHEPDSSETSTASERSGSLRPASTETSRGARPPVRGRRTPSIVPKASQH